MPTGTVKNVVTDRGFFFITQDDGGPDLFAHYKSLIDLELNEQLMRRRVSYTPAINPRNNRECAIDVKAAQ